MVVPDLVKPLALFVSQPQSQRYIKTIKNLGDAWRSLSEEPSTESDPNTIVIETTFDLTLRITMDGQEENSISSVEMICKNNRPFQRSRSTITVYLTTMVQTFFGGIKKTLITTMTTTQRCRRFLVLGHHTLRQYLRTLMLGWKHIITTSKRD